MKKIALLVAGAFLLQQLAPTMLWAGALENAVAGTDSSYELTGDYNVDQNIPSFGEKTDNTFTVNGGNHTLNGGTYDGFSVNEGETLNLNNLTLNGFSSRSLGEDDVPNVSVLNGGTLVVNNVVSNTNVLAVGTGPDDAKGETKVVGSFDSTNGALYQDKVTVAQGGTLEIKTDNLNANAITNDGTLKLKGEKYYDEEKEQFKRPHLSSSITGDGVLEIWGEVKVEGQGEESEPTSVTQKEVNIISGTLENRGVVTAQITNGNNILNTGNGYLYTNGTSVNNGQIIGDEGSKGSIVVASGTFTNNGTIDQTSVTINEGAKLTTALDGNFSTNNAVLVNQGILEVTGGTNTRTIAEVAEPAAQTPGSKGTLLISGNFENGLGATIQQKNVEVASGKTFTQNGNMYATLTNNGNTINNGSEFKINGGSNAGTISTTGDGAMKFIGGEFDNQGTISQSGVEVKEGAKLTTDVQGIEISSPYGHFINDGTLVLTGSAEGRTNTHTIEMTEDTDTGVTHIANGKVINNGLIKQSAFYIDGATDTTAAGHLVTATNTLTDGEGSDYIALHNDGQLTFTGGTNHHAISGAGILNIHGEDGTTVINSNIAIDQARVNIAANNTFDVGGSSIHNAQGNSVVTNEGGILSNGIVQMDKLVNKNSVFVNDGILTIADLDNQAGAQIQNEATLEITNGTNAGSITNAGYGQLDILGQFANTGAGSISHEIVLVHEGAEFTTAADKVTMKGSYALKNHGDLILTGSEDGITSNNRIDGGGTLTIRDGKVINASGKSIAQSNIVVAAANEQAGTAAGAFEAVVQDINGDIQNHATLTLQGVSDAWENEVNTQNSTITGDGDLYISKAVRNERNITQGSVNVTSGNTLANLKTGHITAAINTEKGAMLHNHGTLTVTGGTLDGNLEDLREDDEKHDGEISYESKVEISGGKFVNNGMIRQDNLNILADGEMETAANTLRLSHVISNNGKLTLTSDGMETYGIDIVKNDLFEGPAETIIAGNVGNSIGYVRQDKLTIAAGGTFTKDIGSGKSVLNVGKIVNDGKFNIIGGVIEQNITHTDAAAEDSVLSIQANIGVQDETITIEQKAIEIQGTGGQLSVNADQLIAEKIINDGHLDFRGGTNTTKIDGDGQLRISGDVTNQANLNQTKLEVDGGVIFTHSGNAAENTPYVLKAQLENDGTVQNEAVMIVMNDESQDDPLSKSSVNHEGALIQGKGSLLVGGNFYNLGTIEQNNILILAQGQEEGMTQNGHFITDVDTVQAAITNHGLLTLSSGTTGINTNTIDGDDGTLELAGDITNNGSITQFKVDTQGNTLTNNGTLSFQEAGTHNNIVGSGDMEITGVVAQSGTLAQRALTITESGDLTADLNNITVETFTNDGFFTANADAAVTNDITGKGTFQVTDGAAVVNNGSLTQGQVSVINGSLTTAADHVTASIDNASTLIFTAGTNNNAITDAAGTGHTQIDGVVTNAAAITQDRLTIASGTFNTSLENLTVGTLTNNATLELTGGTLTQEIGRADATTPTTTKVLGDVTVSGGSFNQQALTIVKGGKLTADMDSLSNAGTLTNEGTLQAAGGTIHQALSGSGELVIAGAVLNSNDAADAVNQTQVTVANGGSFTTAADTVKADIVNNGTFTITGGTNNNAITNNASLVFNGGTNNGAIAGNGMLEVAGEVLNNTGKTIANAVTINNGQTLTAYADDILGNVTNNGTFALNGGTLNQAVLGGNTQVIGNVALAQNTTFNNVSVAADKTLDLGANAVTAADMTVNGTLGMSIGNLTKDSSVYSGAKLTLTDKLTLGSDSKLLLAVLSADLQTDDSTDWLTLVDGTIGGTWNNVLAQNARYEITRDGDNQGKVKIKYTVSAGEAAQEAGANQNEAAAADAWDEVAKTAPAGTVARQVADAMNVLSQDVSRKKEYVEALESLAPVQVAMAKTNVTNVNQSIYTVANNHMSGGAGMAAGDAFSYKSVWMQGMFNKTKYNVEGGFDGNTYGGAVGLDISNEEDTTLGIGYAYAYSSLKATGKKIKADTQNVFLYGNYTGLEDWYFDGTLGYNFGSYKEDKTVTGITGNGKYHVNSLAAQAMAQYTVNEYFAPLAGLRYVFAHQGSYTDGFDQKMSSTNDHTLTALLGAKVGKNFQAGSLVLKPLFKAAATFDVLQHGDNVTVTLPTSSYKVESEQLKKFGVETGLSLGMDLSDQVELTLGYDGQFRSHYYNHTGSAKLKYSF